MRVNNLAVIFGVVLAAVAAPVQAACVQIVPNPNPAGQTLTNASGDGCNELVMFDNFGTLVNSARLDNAGALRNFGQLFNTGTLNNFGGLANVQSRAGHIRNTGTLNNFGNVDGHGSTNNGGIVNNYGTFSAGDFGENTGVVNNYSGATLLSGQRYTNDGVVNNSLGGTIKTVVGWINNGTINNAGTLSYENSRFLNNNGIINNNVGGTLRTSNELKNVGLLKIGGELENHGRINTSGRLVINDSGKLTGSGYYLQSAGTTVVRGSLVQAAVHVSDGVLTGSGAIVSPVRLDGGTLAPGDSPGVLTIHGNYTQTGTSHFAAEIGGRRMASGYDSLRVSGTATLDGELDIILRKLGGASFIPHQGDTFDILAAEAIVGSFRRVSFEPLPGNLRWQVQYLKDVHNSIDVVRLVVTNDTE